MLVQNDIFKLIAGGAPDDEYRLEIPKIIKFIDEALTAEDVAGKLEDMYEESFSPASTLADSSDYLRLAKDLFELKPPSSEQVKE